MKEKLYVKVTAEEVYKRKLRNKIITIATIALLLILSVFYLILYIINVNGDFTITLDPTLASKNNIIMSNYKDFHHQDLTLSAESLEYMDNISETWLPKDLDTNKEGPHNGKNYIAYTFFLKNAGKEKIDYWASIEIKSVIKNVDEAVRVAVYQNGKRTVYAKKAKSGNAEPNTKTFYSVDKVMNESRKNFKPNDVDRYTVVIWVEGDDPECLDNILGGEMKMEMYIREEHTEKR